jgi:hypothetical protein
MSAVYTGAGVDDTESIRTIRCALDLGITLIDTAEAYGPYSNEELVTTSAAPTSSMRSAPTAGGPTGGGLPGAAPRWAGADPGHRSGLARVGRRRPGPHAATPGGSRAPASRWSAARSWCCSIPSTIPTPAASPTGSAWPTSASSGSDAAGEAGAWMGDLRRLGSQGRYFSASTVTCSSPPSDRKNFGTRRSHLPRQHRPRRRNDIVLGTDRRLGFRRDGTAATALASAAVVIAAPALAPAPPAVASSRQPR